MKKKTCKCGLSNRKKCVYYNRCFIVEMIDYLNTPYRKQNTLSHNPNYMTEADYNAHLKQHG